jgi:hypothetical protein
VWILREGSSSLGIDGIFLSMPRRQSIKSGNERTPASTRSHKRQLSSGATQSAATPTAVRASKRIKDSASNTPVSVTPKKSKYFEASGSDDDQEGEEATSDDGEVSGYEDEEASAGDSPTSEESSEDDFDSEEDAKPKRRKAGKKGGSTPASIGKSSQLWREGVKTGLGPGKQVFIAKPKPRGDGGIKYKPGEIHPNTSKCDPDSKEDYGKRNSIGSTMLMAETSNIAVVSFCHELCLALAWCSTHTIVPAWTDMFE